MDGILYKSKQLFLIFTVSTVLLVLMAVSFRPVIAFAMGFSGVGIPVYLNSLLFLAAVVPHPRTLDPGSGSQCGGCASAVGSSPACMRIPISFTLPDPIRGQSATSLCTGRFSVLRLPATTLIYPDVSTA